jgi:two-component system sensor histidine kinase SenX3
MNLTRRRGAKAFFIVLGVCLTVLAVALNITWIHSHGRRLAIDLVGIILFSILIAGVVLNTVFLVREIRRNERQDSFPERRHARAQDAHRQHPSLPGHAAAPSRRRSAT